ncbi:hypothetical protein ALP29_05056 [Pseudomonas syringae pv. avii]|uniref:HTH IS21-type domain-containing protein n=1 Tax=Pseudomonas syringae pv. avii TaxID=663959 RepID=A0A3M5UDF8_PSESX|nr:hypothetical protein ALP29_05056 [Pseudomonas syringae pv. avii]
MLTFRAGDHQVISMEMMGKIRRMYFRDKLSLHQIAKRTGLSRNTIRKWLRAPETKQPVYQRQAAFNKLSPFHGTRAGSQSRFASGKTQPQNRKGSLRADQSRGLRRRFIMANYPVFHGTHFSSAPLIGTFVIKRRE